MKFPTLFSVGTIGRMEVKNRFVMPPMVRNYATVDGLVTDRYVAHIERIARGGVGMMILEASFVREDGKGFRNELGLHSDEVVRGLRRLAAAAHAHGAKIGIQLYHAGRQTSAKNTGVQPVAPSAIPDPSSMEMPRALKATEIADLVGAYADGAARAKKAGLDFVEIHGAHGYLITQFLSPFSNGRTDAYGGSSANRLRFLEEVYAAVRDAVGDDYPVILRLSADEQVAGGLRLSDTKRIAKRMERLGMDAIHVSAGNYASYAKGLMIPPMAIPDEPLVPLAAGIRGAVGIPVIAVGKIRTPAGAERILKSGKADFVGIGRTLLADPDYPNKVRDGRLDEISPCIACNQACISRLFAQQDVLCTVNPKCGREKEFERKLGKKKRILVIGGGPAGLSAAKTAAERGHEVVLYERNAKLGGQVIAAAVLPYRADWGDFLRALIGQVKRLRVDIRLREEFESADVRKGEYDAAIVAVGSAALRPDIPGIDRANVISARSLLEGWSKAKGRIVVAGGGCMGAQVAENLALKGHAVTIVEAGPAIATDAPVDDRALLLGRLKELRVKIVTGRKVVEISASSVTVEGSDGAKKILADTVVLCLGTVPVDGIAEELKSLVKTVTVVGDARAQGRVTEAVAEGALAALAL